mmetsp:Transcript_85596/g.228226  ORF Transcript_85596/g.228226 Transcript_85596/m.228226 type:complete len:170 (+) Transcript_85596:2729-3238(+)
MVSLAGEISRLASVDSYDSSVQANTIHSPQTPLVGFELPAAAARLGLGWHVGAFPSEHNGRGWPVSLVASRLGISNPRRVARRSMATGHVAAPVAWPCAEETDVHKITDLQLLIEQTARYVQHFEKPPYVLGYPVSWEVLRYASISMIGAILTGLQGTGALLKIMKMLS